jgi:hypothetical protein
VHARAEAERLWSVLLDGRRWFEWNQGIEWIALEGPLAPGTVLTMKPRRGPQTAFRVEDVDVARLLALVVTFGPVAAMRFRWELAPQRDGTAIAQTLAISGPLAGMLLRRTAERIASAMEGNLERLAARAEGEEEKERGRDRPRLSNE